jgi:hypothetical protein
MTEATTQPAVEPDVKAGTDTVDAGALAIRPGQGMRNLSARQRAAFRAIVNFEPNDPLAWPHIEVFLERCVSLSLNPWAREAYLIKRGTGSNATYTAQTGIDGYRKLANDSGKYHSAARVYWTGPDDDPEWWHLTEDEFGITVKRRVWVDAWIWPDRHPAAARALIRHYDDHGNVQVSDATAHWGMFAPYNPKWEGSGDKRRKVIDPETGRPVMELAEMWRRDGGAQQLGKCVEALVLRKAFPAKTSGIYIHEEMDQADVRAHDDLDRARTEAFERAHAQAIQPAQGPGQADGDAHTHTQGAHETPVDVEVVHDDDTPLPTPALVSDDERRAWMDAEIHHLAAIIGKPEHELRESLGMRLTVPLDKASPQAVVGVLGAVRAGAVTTLRQRGLDGVADAYASVPDDMIAPVEALFGGTDLWRMAAPHPFAMQDANDACTVCDGYEDDRVHGGDR